MAPRCRKHPRAAAGWKCRGCGAPLCPDCVASTKAGFGQVTSCSLCGGLADRLKRHRSERSYLSRLPGAVAYPLSQSGLIAMVAVGVVLALASYLGSMAKLVATGAEWAYVFHLVRGSAMGRDEIDAPDFSDFFEDIVLPALRSLVATAYAWAPLLIYSSFYRGDVDTPLWTDPVAWLIGVLGIAYVPMALIIAASGGGILRMVNPVVVVAHVARIPRDYAVAVVAVAVTLGVDVLLTVIGGALQQAIPVPFISRWIGQTLTVYAPFVLARVLGLLLYVRGDALEYGLADDYWEPLLPDSEAPRGTPIAVPSHEALAASAGHAVPAETAAVHDHRSEPAPVPARVDPAAEIKDALVRDEHDRAVALYADHPNIPPKALGPDALLLIGRKAANAKNFEVATRALRAAGTVDPQHAVAPRAFVVLGRIYAEALNDPATSQRIFRFVVDRYPGTEAAAFAKGRLDGTT